MKKLIALMMSLLMVILIFASCDENREEPSGEPVSEVPSVEISSEEEKSEISSGFTSEPYMAPITEVSDEELELYEKLKFLPITGVYFASPEEIDADMLSFILCRFVCNEEASLFQKTYNEKVASLKWGEIYSYPIEEAENILQTYFGEYPFAEKLKQSFRYNSETNTIDIDGLDISSWGGVSLTYPLPFIREGNQTTIYGLYSQSEGEDKIQIISGHKIVIMENGDTIQFVSFVELEEDEIADLNEQYFGEK